MRFTKVKIKLVKKGAVLPSRMTQGSSGFDIYAAESIEVPPASMTRNRLVEVGHASVGTGLIIQLPQNSVGRIASRSGLSRKHNIEVGAGWIDPDYRGEIVVELKNMSSKPFMIKTGDRIAQLFILATVKAIMVTSRFLSVTGRGSSGFGSTGVSRKKG